MNGHNQDYIETYLQGIRDITDSISRADIDDVVEALFAVWRRGGKVFIVGNGGSASTATHFAADLNKCTIVDSMPRFKVFALNDNIPLVSALTNDNGWEDIYTEQLRNFFEPGDAVIAISVHGGTGRDQAGVWSQNLVKALLFARDNGGVAIGLSGFDGGAFNEVARHNIVVPYDTTPHVESYHVVLHHLITFCLREKIVQQSRVHAASTV